MQRFYTDTSVHFTDDGYSISLDHQPLYTPGKHKLRVPTRKLAEAIAAEWDAQGEKIDKHRLWLTGYASLALDIITHQRNELLEELAEYGETDLLLYHEDQEEALITLQATEWLPWVDWARKRFGTHYLIAGGIMPVAQPVENRAKHIHALESWNIWQLAGMAGSVKITTSFLLSTAFMENALNAADLYRLSRLEEDYNIRKWGEDDEAIAKAKNVAEELHYLQIWRDLLTPSADAAGATK